MQNRGNYATGLHSRKAIHQQCTLLIIALSYIVFFNYVFQIFQLIQPFTFFLAFHEKVLFHSKRFEVCPQQNLKPLLLHLTVAAVLKTLG